MLVATPLALMNVKTTEELLEKLVAIEAFAVPAVKLNTPGKVILTWVIFREVSVLLMLILNTKFTSSFN